MPKPREQAQTGDMRLPFPLFPKPGEDVVWYSDSVRTLGTLVGYNKMGRASILSNFGNPLDPVPLYILRRCEAIEMPSPSWENLPERAGIWKPTSNEVDQFRALLEVEIPPGPSYLNLVEEMWARGFETFVVGGTVRDVLRGQATNDVDLVTSMPIPAARGLLKSMHGTSCSFSEKNGFCRVGGSPGSGDPFIDVKMFFSDGVGTRNPLFGSDIQRDSAYRDFACNSVYFDPINEVLIDPTGRGVEDAEDGRLAVVYSPGGKDPVSRGKIAIRFFKFLARGWHADEEALRTIRKDFVPKLTSLRRAKLIQYVRSQVLGKATDRVDALDQFRAAFSANDFEDVWEQYFKPVVGELGGV